MKKFNIFTGIVLICVAMLTLAAPVNTNSSNISTSVAPPATPTTTSSTTPTSTTTTPAAPVKHMWNLQGVDIKSVVTEISRETGKNFILDPQVQGKVTIISSHPMGPKESYDVFLSTLRVLGYAVVPDGVNLKIVPTRDAANQAQFANDQNPGYGDQVVVRVLKMHYVSAMQMVPALRPLIPTWGNLSAYAPSNALILSGTAENVQRIADIVNEVDTPAANGIDVVRLKHAVADDLVKELNKLILASRANGAGTTATLSSDDQSNSVLISGDETSRLRLKVLVAKIDNEDATANNNTQVFYLKYIQVKDILPILKGMFNESVSYSMSSGTAAVSSSSSSGSSSDTLGQASASYLAAANSMINNATLNSSSGSSANNKSKVSIVGDVTNNALVITANPTDMLRLRSVIEKLDVPPKQILVQGVIAEVDAQTAKQLGIQWGSGGSNQSQTSMGVPASNQSPFAFDSGGMGVGFLESGDLRALLALLQTDTSSNIVSTPSVTVLNNSPADIEVGQNISQVSAQYQNDTPGQTILPPTTFTDKQIGLTLKVIPQITGDHSIRLIIDQQNSSLVADAKTSSSNPNQPINEEKISTQVLVNNGQVVVLGGLISAQDTKIISKVPILGDIPILGRLFQNHNTSKVKKDLMIFLRPEIISSPSQADELAQNKYDFMRDVAILNGNGNGNLIATSTLPARKNEPLPTPFAND